MHIVVLGAGLIGVSSTWFLTEAGHQVTLIDRQAGPALETSFANGGQISASHAEPWATPRTPLKMLQWLGREDAPLCWRWRADTAQWLWGLRFLRECLPARTRANTQAILALAVDSRQRLKQLRRELQLEYDCLEAGILHFYTAADDFSRAAPQAALMRAHGCERRLTSAQECLAIEPALAAATTPIVGGTYTAEDESGDAQRFCTALAQHCEQQGVHLRFNTSLSGFETQADKSGRRIVAARLADGSRLQADAFVLASGSETACLVRQLGLRLALYPAKGYSITIPLTAATAVFAPRVSLIDDACKLVYSRLGQQLRVAGTAEFNGYDKSLNPKRIALLVRRVRQIFPRLAFDETQLAPWAGLRPATPGNLPLIGRASNYGNLYLNTGHGTLGWTMAVGSGKLLADLLLERTPELDPQPYSPA